MGDTAPQFTPEQQAALDEVRARLEFTPEQRAALEEVRARLSERGGPIRDVTRMGETALGLGEAGLSLVSGIPGEIVGGLGGLIEGVESTIRGEDDPVQSAEKRINDIARMMTFEPRTEAGRSTLEFVSQPFQKLAEFADVSGAVTQDITGSPSAAATVRGGIEFLPGLVGMRGPRVSRLRDIRRVERMAERTGVDLMETPLEQKRQVRASAEEQVGGRTVRGEDLQTLQTKVQDERRLAKDAVDELYNNARRERAGIPVAEARQFPDMVRSSLEDFDVEMMPVVQKRLFELAQIEDFPVDSAVKLQEFEKWRKRLSTNKPPKNDLSQNLAIGIMKARYESFMDAMFNADMIKGSPEAIQMWRDARAANTSYRARFRDHKVIRQLAEQQANATEIRNWIFGANAVGAKTEAARVVTLLKDILGENSAQFTALRQEALLDIFEPVLQRDMNIDRFVKNVDRITKNAPDLVEALALEPKTAVRDLAEIARAVEKTDPLSIPFALDEAIVRWYAGHGIHRGAVRQKAITFLVRFLRGGGSKNRRRKIMGEVLGYDPFAPMIGKLPVILGGGVQAGIEAAEVSAENRAALESQFQEMLGDEPPVQESEQ